MTGLTRKPELISRVDGNRAPGAIASARERSELVKARMLLLSLTGVVTISVATEASVR